MPVYLPIIRRLFPRPIALPPASTLGILPAPHSSPNNPVSLAGTVMAHSRFPRAAFGKLPRIGGSFPKMASNNPASRLSIISQHFAAAQPQAPSGPSTYQARTFASSSPPKMSSQPSHSTLLIPGPIEFDDAVLQSMSHYRSVLPAPAVSRVKAPIAEVI